ncbi:NAD(P)/FAD-dependent oxidoreductase [Beijerinckia sp. L45]|uniref:flavin monoamine oxidase family protein n=1 Tax=Beijerinckia sp. L45 TaxID=1641855 RepID=UPI00131B5641|nr:NAD(P)/FAD-dependent oxidoreductase [Beijerinckia sp. L45]
MSLLTHPVVIIGAGAAGIAAGRELRRRGIGFVILEARDRIGGRAWSIPYGTSAPLDLGCEWLHSADANILAAMAPDHGFALDKSEAPWRRPAHQADFTAADQQAFWAAQAVFEAKLADAAAIGERTGQDRAAAEFLEPGGRWNSLIDAISTYYNGAPLNHVSVIDYARYRDTEVDWRVTGGYGAFIAALGADLPIKLGCVVSAVDATGPTIRLETSDGRVETNGVIVTVPTTVLASGAITFTPALDDHLAAAAALPLGVADKLFLALDRPEDFAPDTRLIGATGRTDAGSYTSRPRGRPMIEGYFGGDYARALEQRGLPAFAEAALDEIAGVLGNDIRRRLTPILATGWARDPFALGSYSHALPGQAAARAVLATPVDDRILFAGEATSPHFFSTAHGAFESGLAAGQSLGSYVERHETLRRDQVRGDV